MSAAVPTLWHFTCSHAAVDIGRRGVLRPNPHPLLAFLGLVWLTSDPMPQREDVGLTSTILACDRVEHRYRVTDPSMCVPWLSMAAMLDPYAAALLGAGCHPSSWWVSVEDVPVVAS